MQDSGHDSFADFSVVLCGRFRDFWIIGADSILENWALPLRLRVCLPAPGNLADSSGHTLLD